MRSWIDWLKGTGLAAVCVLAVGCGGGDSNEPAADGTAASEGDAGGGEPAAPAPEVAAAPAQAPGMPPGMRRGMRPGMPGMPGGPGGMGAKAGEGATADAPGGTAASSEGGAPPAAKGAEGGSTTAEMLAMATGGPGAPGGDTQAPGAQPGAGAGGPGGPGAMMGRPGGPPPGYPGAGGSSGSMPGAPGSGGTPGAPGGVNSDMMARMMQQQQRQQQQQQQNRGGPPAGYPGAGGFGRQGGPGGFGPGGPQQDNGPADTHSPDGAARAFLKALGAKDRSRLAEATALRSQGSAGPGGDATPTKKQELFAKILDESISDTELDDLAKDLDGFKVAGENAAKSTGSLGIIIHKPTDDGGYLSRVLTVRKEKKGWGVMDISRETVFKGMAGQRRRTTGGRN